MFEFKLGEVERREVVELYRSGVRVGEIANRYGVATKTVQRLARRAGEGRPARKGVVRCSNCGIAVERYFRFRTRDKFCKSACYYEKLKNPEYRRDVYGMRQARKVVGRYFRLEGGMVVHHVDGDNRNNELGNLMVFASQGDHLVWHRLGGELSGIRPVWVGASSRVVLGS